MKKSILVLVTSALLITLFPGAAKAAPGDTTIFPVLCVSSGWTNVYLEYGINSVTITNPSGCDVSQSFYFSNGSGSTWTYSETIGDNTTPKTFVPGVSFQTGAIGSRDSFTLTLTSSSSNYITISGGVMSMNFYFNNEFNTLSPSPVAIGEQVTVSGNNLSSLTSLTFYDANYDSFTFTTANRTATQLTFVVSSTVVDWFGATIPVTPGVYRLSSVLSKTLTITAAPIVVSVSAEELAAQRLSESMAAAAVREAEKMMARGEIEAKSKSSESISVELFARAEIPGINKENIEAVQTEIYALPASLSGDITGILKIARK